jgi:DNA-binding NtrC family response regulator
MQVEGPVVLLVEDNGTLRSTLRRYLERRLPVVPVEAATASEAVLYAKRYRPAVILLDLSLPDAPGVAAIEKLQSIGHGGRLIVMVSHLERQYSEQAARAGAWACIPKEMLGSRLETLVWRALPPSKLSIGHRLNRWQVAVQAGRLGTLRNALSDAWAGLICQLQWLNDHGPWADRPRTRLLYLANVVELVLVLVIRQHTAGA